MFINLAINAVKSGKFSELIRKENGFLEKSQEALSDQACAFSHAWFACRIF